MTQAQAESERKNGRDVVVCGPVEIDNLTLANAIEAAAGPAKHCAPHLRSAGPGALPHFQQVKKPPRGHTFYEALGRKAI